MISLLTIGLYSECILVISNRRRLLIMGKSCLLKPPNKLVLFTKKFEVFEDKYIRAF